MANLSYEDLLKAALSGANAKFDKADGDLRKEVANAAEGVDKISGGKVRLALTKAQESEDFVIYALMLTLGAGGDNILFFRITSQGYPIETTPQHNYYSYPSNHPDRDKYVSRLASPEALHEFFLTLGSNPDSVLVRKLAFLLRRLQGSR